MQRSQAAFDKVVWRGCFQDWPNSQIFFLKDLEDEALWLSKQNSSGCGDCEKWYWVQEGQGMILTFHNLALDSFKGCGYILLSDLSQAQEAYWHFHKALGTLQSHKKPYVHSKSQRFEYARGQEANCGLWNYCGPLSDSSFLTKQILGSSKWCPSVTGSLSWVTELWPFKRFGEWSSEQQISQINKKYFGHWKEWELSGF